MVEGPYTPHETRMLALQMALEFVNGDKNKSTVYTTSDVIVYAKKFEAYLTSAPIDGFDSATIGPDDAAPRNGDGA